ncbi:universal stress protein [Natronorubrum halophilum]|uniref:universal stress protein n=1 Tax=Natronorubrum halophilum TaxID=1702106 RepID=UPI0010C200F9|nr:universal stress protein [Natronorubrum halophilum]
MHYLVGTVSVHTTAAICDYLDERATSDDTVTVVAVTPTADATARRDAQEALNVAPVRLTTVGTVDTERRTDAGDPSAELLEAASAVDADEIVITPYSGVSNTPKTVGSTVRKLLENAPLPVVVVPGPVL